MTRCLLFLLPIFFLLDAWIFSASSVVFFFSFFLFCLKLLFYLSLKINNFRSFYLLALINKSLLKNRPTVPRCRVRPPLKTPGFGNGRKLGKVSGACVPPKRRGMTRERFTTRKTLGWWGAGRFLTERKTESRDAKLGRGEGISKLKQRS